MTTGERAREASLGRRALLRASVALLAGCGRRDVAFTYLGERSFSRAERAAIEACAEATIGEVRRLLPALPRALALTVDTGSVVIPETGETATAYPPSTIAWVVDPSVPGGIEGTVRSQLRYSLFHELHHLVRDAAIPRRSMMDHVVAEGLATVFERDAGAKPPWGAYTAEAASWAREVEALAPDANVATWLYGKHADGRRWIGLRAGTYLADRAIRALGRTAGELVADGTARLLDAARA